MRKLPKWTLLTVTVFICGPTLAASVKPTMVTETRVKSLAAPGQPQSFVPNSFLQVTLRVSGKDLKGASRVGHWQIQEATDNLGNSLIDSTNTFQTNSWIQLSPFMIDKRDGSFPVTLSLKAAPRKATRLRSLKASFTVLAGGKSQVAIITRPKSQLGQTITDETLKAAGVELQLLPPAKFAGARSVRFSVGGKMESLLRIEARDKSGKQQAIAYPGPATADNKQTYFIYLPRPLSDEMTFAVTVAVGQSAIKVPVDVQNLPLP